MMHLSRSSSSIISSSLIELEVDLSNTPSNNNLVQQNVQDIFKEVWPNIKQKFVKVNKFFFFNTDMKSVKHNEKIGVSKKNLKKIVKQSVDLLSESQIGTNKLYVLKKKKRYEQYYIQLRENDKKQLKLMIQRVETSNVTNGSQGNISFTQAIHNGKQSVFKVDTPESDSSLTVERERKVLIDLYKKTIELIKPDTYFSEQLVSPTGHVFIPIVKPSHAFYSDNEVTGMFLERGLGSLFDNFQNLKFEDRCQVAKDITMAVMIFEELKHFHLDIKPENIILFRVEGKIRAKLVDFGYAEGHLTEDSIKTLEEDSLLRGAAAFIDAYGAMDSRLQDKDNINLAEKNRFLLRRDRVALSRVLLELFLGPENCDMHEIEDMKATEWMVDRSRDLDFFIIYDRLKDRTANYPLKEAIKLLQNIEQIGELV